MATEKKTQLYFRDAGSFEFIKRPLKYSCMVQEENGQLIRAWKHFYSNQIPFAGYKNISADTVTLGFARDIILDPFNKVPTGLLPSEKPTKTDTGIKKWISQVAENQRHTYRTQIKSSFKEDAINWALIGTLILMMIGWLIRYATG
jgi:hypothetical protein